MSYAIKLPEIIASQHNVHNSAALIEDIKKYAREIGWISVILSDNYMDKLYTKLGLGYMATMEMITEWAEEFVRTYAHVEEWEEFIYSDKNPYGSTDVICWDDFVIRFGYEKINAL